MRVTETCPCGAALDIEDAVPLSAPTAMTFALLSEFRLAHQSCRTAVTELVAELVDP